MNAQIANGVNKKTIVSLVVIIVGVASLVWWSKSVDNKKLNAEGSEKYHLARTGNITANSLTALETFYDFGTISMKNGNVSKTFRVTNPTSGEVKISRVTTSCMCTNAYILNPDGSKKGPFGMPGHGGAVPKANAVVKAGESLDIDVVYDPNAHGPAGVGLIKRSVFVEEENGKIIEFQFQVNVTP